MNARTRQALRPAAAFTRHPLAALTALSLAASLVLLLFTSLGREFDHDEFEALHTAWKLWRGERIYEDFIQHHHPFTHYLLLPLYRLFGADLAVLSAARLLVFANLVALLLLTSLIAAEVYGDRLNAALSALLLSVTGLFIFKAIEIRPDVFQSSLGLLSLLLVVRFFRLRDRRLMVMGGVAAGLSILFLQKGIVFTGLVGFVLLGRWLWSYPRGRDIKFSDGLLFAGSVVGAVLPYALFLLVSGRLPTFVFYNYTFNTLYYDLRGYELGKLLGNAMTLFSQNTPVVLLFAVTLLLLPKGRLEWELVFLAAGVLGFAVATGRHNPQYYLLVWPLASVLAARGLTEGFRGRLAALTLVFAVAPPLARGLSVALEPTNRAQLAEIAYVLNVTDEDDYVYDGNITFNLFRRDVDFVWYLAGSPYKAVQTLAALRGYDYDVLRAIERYRPAVISTFGISDLTDPRIARHYAPSARYPHLYLRVR